MSKDIPDLVSEQEVLASEKRAKRLKEVNEDLQSNKDSAMADILAEIAAKNKKQYE